MQIQTNIDEIYTELHVCHVYILKTVNARQPIQLIYIY
jgi:hypothetical protein